MSVYIITVEVTDAYTEQFEVVVLAHTEKSARVLATRLMVRRGFFAAHSVDARVLDSYKTGVVMYRRKEAADGR